MNARRANGFSLIELMIALAIAAILLGLAVPQFSQLVQRNRLATATNDMLALMASLRSEALRRGHVVTACVSTDGATCAAAGNWHDGWISFADRNANGVRDATESLITQTAAREPGMTMTGNAPVALRVSYEASGRTRLSGGGLQMGTVTVCLAGAARRIIVNAAGRVRVESTGC